MNYCDVAISIQDLAPELAKEFDTPNSEGALIGSVEPKDALQEVGRKLYAKAAARTSHTSPHVQEPPGEPRPSGSGPRGKVVGAEFRETK